MPGASFVRCFRARVVNALLMPFLALLTPFTPAVTFTTRPRSHEGNRFELCVRHPICSVQHMSPLPAPSFKGLHADCRPCNTAGASRSLLAIALQTTPC